MTQLLWKTLWQFLKRLDIELSYDPPILLPCIYPREMKTDVYTKTFTICSFVRNLQVKGFQERQKTVSDVRN